MKKIIIVVGVVVVVLIGAVLVDLKFFSQIEPEQIACTMEAKLCWDGSAVGRTGPNCEFAECPVQNDSVYKDISYEIEGQIVALKNSTSTKYFSNEVKGDFNGDGLEDVAFLLTQDSGGSGTFFYVVGALRGVDGFQGINGIFLGDRIAPQTTLRWVFQSILRWLIIG